MGKSIRLPLLTELKIRARHYYYNLFKKRYIAEALKKRKGSCKNCGRCCRVLFFGFFKCPLFDADHNKCKVYGEGMPKSCKRYPFDRGDRYGGKIPELEEHCGYSWGD